MPCFPSSLAQVFRVQHDPLGTGLYLSLTSPVDPMTSDWEKDPSNH